jgi:hypothetical protein
VPVAAAEEVSVEELLQPRTDAGVLTQVGVVVALVALLAWRVRRDTDLLRLVLGAGMFTLGLFVLRAMH